jgi:hypothetical protein
MTYGLAYVLIPAAFASLQAELDRALAPFRRGGRGDLPDEQLAFDDVTPGLRRLHGSVLTVERSGQGGITIRAPAEAQLHLVDFAPLRDWLHAQGLHRWRGTLAELEPDFDRFVGAWSRWERHPLTGGYGQWLNPLGRWDWWELGGRFDGVISGAPARAPRASRHMISSGPNPGRDLIDDVTRALGGRTSDVEAEIEANVEPVTGLLAAAATGARHAVPSAIVLPCGACPDACRWLDDVRRHAIPPAARRLLGAADDAPFSELARAAYRRFPHHAAAGVAYHW